MKEKAKERVQGRYGWTTKWNKRKQQLNEPTNMLIVIKFKVVDTPSKTKNSH